MDSAERPAWGVSVLLTTGSRAQRACGSRVSVPTTERVEAQPASSSAARPVRRRALREFIEGLLEIVPVADGKSVRGGAAGRIGLAAVPFEAQMVAAQHGAGQSQGGQVTLAHHAVLRDAAVAIRAPGATVILLQAQAREVATHAGAGPQGAAALRDEVAHR